jgi:hypothetical protein
MTWLTAALILAPATVLVGIGRYFLAQRRERTHRTRQLGGRRP